jgi:ribosomal protein S18 acetylase RimI-like enzyme
VPFELRIASKADAQALATLVNRAYRPSSQQDMGWTHEANLIAGKRTTVEQIISLFGNDSAILTLSNNKQIAACVYIQKNKSFAYIGMLATDPRLQAQGLGKSMLSHAEKYAAESFQTSKFKISVISSRPELFAFYERRGYVFTGETEAYPFSAGVGQPMVEDIRVLSLTKSANPLSQTAGL